MNRSLRRVVDSNDEEWNAVEDWLRMGYKWVADINPPQEKEEGNG